MSYKYSWTVTSNYHYDATLTTALIKDYLADWLDSSGKDNHFYSLSNMGNLSIWPSDREKQHDTSYHNSTTTDEPMDPVPANSTYEYYENFKMATGLNFAELRSSAAAAGLASHAYIPNGLGLADNTSAGNITFDKNGEIEFAGSNTLARDITFIDGGYVYFQPGPGAGSGNQTLTGLLASRDLDSVFIAKVARGGSVTLSGGQVRRNLRELSIAEEYNGWTPVSSQTGSGVLVDGLVVRGVLNSVYVASGASVNLLTVGLDRQWSGSDVSAFLYESNGVLVPQWWGSQTTMIIASGGTATNITLGNGGTVYVSGLSDTVSSTYNSTTSKWEYTTHYASGTGGILKDLNMASSGGLQFEGITDPRATWNYPSNGYLNSRSYMSGFLATAPQSSYVSFGSNASGSNINIGKGGSLYIDKGARVSAISMGGLTTSTTFVNSSGTTDTWIGDRGASLQIRGGYVSGVVMDPVLQTFDYYSAAHDYFWLYSSSVSSSMQSAYYASHGEYPSGSAWESAVYASASAGYRQYMSAMYNSGAVYTNLGDDTAYNRRYVGGDIGVAGGWIMNVSGFSYLGVAADVDVTVSNNVSTWKTYQYTDGNVSKAIGAVSATLDVTGGAHVYNVKIEGGRVIMTGGGEVNARWHSRENKQSNYNLVEDLDLRIGDVLGLGSAYPAVIEFFGEGSGGYKQYISSGGTSGYVDYTWDAIDPGEIHSVTASKGLVVHANWTTHQDFTYTGSGAVTFNGLGTVVLKDNHSRYSSDSYYGTGPYLGSAFDEYYFGVVKGVYNEEDGVLENYTVLDGDVSSGGFDWEGFLMVGSGGIVQNIGSTSPLKTGNDIVNSDTWTPSYTRDKCKVLTVVAGGLADKVTVKGAVSNFEHFESQYTESRAGLLVSSGGTATNVTVLEGGIAMAKGGTIDKVFVAAGGVLYLSGWAGAHQVGERDSDGHVDLSGPQYMDTTVLNGVRLDSGGQLTNTLDYGFRKGNAPSVIANKGGGIMNGVTANGVAYVSGLDYAGGITLTKDQQAIDVTVRGFTTVTSRDAEGNPTAWTTTIAYMNVSSGGIVNGATVGEDGALYVSDGANVKNLIASGGRLIFGNSSGWSDYFPGSATVSGITVMDGGILEVNSKFALKATDMQVRESAGLEVNIAKNADEDHAVTELNGTWTASWGSGTFTTTDGVLSGFGGQFGFEYTDPIYGSKYTSARLSMTFLNSATLLDGDMRGFGYFSVRDGAKVLNTKLKGITANIGGGGYASGLFAMTDPTNSAYQTNIYVYGNSQKGTSGFAEQTVMSGGYMMVEDGGFANGVTMLAPEGYEGPAGDSKKVGPVELEIVAGGTVSNVYASAGVVTVTEGSKDPGTGPSTLSNAEIHSSAMLLVNADGVVLDGALKLAGTVVTTAERYKYVEVQVTDPDTNETYTDWQRVTLNNAVADAKTLTVSFDLTEHSEGFETAMIDNMANLDGAKYEFIYVNENQAAGSYVLAGNAQDYKTGALKVVRGGKSAGTITVSDGWGVLQVDDDLTYTVNHNANNELVFSVENTDAVIENIVATSDGKELLKGKWSKYAVNIKTEVNQYSKSIWYRIKQAVKPQTRGLLRSVVEVEDDWIELDNEKGIDITEYCTVELKAKNENGKDSEIVEYTVNYDASAPVIDGLALVSGEAFLTPGVESAVSVSVTDDLDAAPALQVSLNDGEWTDVVRNDDGTYVFNLTGGIAGFQLRAVDHAENETVLSVSVPADPVAAADVITVTNQDVTVSAEFSADSTLKQYSLDGGATWQAYGDGVVLKDNASVSFRAGNILGYSGVTTLTVDYIDKVAPEKPTAAADITELTNKDVTVTATFSADSVKKEYTLDDGATWQAYDEGGVIIIINGTVGFRGTDAAGNVSEVATLTVDNIDKTAPEVPTGLQAAVVDQSVTLSWTASTDANGVKEYTVKYSHDGQEFTVTTAETTLVVENLDFATWQWSVTAADTVGNVSEAAAGEAFTVEQSVPVNKYIAKSDIDGNGVSDVMFVWTGNNYQHGYWMNGTSEWQSAGSSHPAEWENLGCHDMNGNGKADSVLVGNVEYDGVKGAYIGFYTDAIDNPDGSTWQNIGYLNNADEIAWKNAVGNLTGNEGANSIVWYAPELFAVGAWTDGTDSWVTLSNSFGGDAWTLVGCGDFSGDGKDSVLMSYNNGQLFYTVGTDGVAQSLGGANWSGWEVRAIGDFSGDKKDDLVLFHKDSGSVVMLADGNADSYTSIGQLDAEDWFVVGAGDYDGDQKDDLLVRQYSTGMLGYYSSGDMAQWNTLGYGVDMNWSVIA